MQYDIIVCIFTVQKQIVMITRERLKEYLGLYIGCDYACFYTGQYHYEGDKLTPKVLYELSGNFESELFKIILRPLNDINEDEVKVLNTLWNGSEPPRYVNCFNPRQFAWLLSKQFDILNLIEMGLAIDKTKLNK